MPLGVRLKYLAPQVVFVGSRHPRLRRRVSPLLHYTIIGIALDGSAGHAITDFQSEQIWSMSFSPDGKSLAVLRGHYDSDVVLLQESK